MGLSACGGGAPAPAGDSSAPQETESTAEAGADSGEAEDIEKLEEAEEEDITGTLAEHDATVLNDAGEAVKLSELAAGKPLVVNFWATWCPYCVEEMPDFKQIVADYDGNVTFAFIDAVDGESEKVDDTKAWLAENDFTSLPVYYDDDSSAVNAFEIYAFPTTVVFDSMGNIVNVTAGAIDPAEMRATLDSVM